MYMSKIISNQSINCLLINWIEKVGIEILNNPKAFTDYSQGKDDVHENLEKYYRNKEKESVNCVWWYDRQI